MLLRPYFVKENITIIWRVVVIVISKVISKLNKFFLSTNEAAFHLAEISVVAMCLIMAFEVIMRYLFGKPTSWSMEYTSYLTVMVCFFGVAYVLRLKQHVIVDTVYSTFSKKTQHIISVFSYLAAFAFISVVTWEGWNASWTAYVVGSRSSSELRVPLFIPKAIIPIGALLLAIQIIVVIWEHIAALVGSKE